MKYYTIKEVAELSGKSQKTVRRYIASNILKSEKVSNKYRIYEDSFNEWIKNIDNLEKNDTSLAAITADL
ncbi:MAG: helix-turn-helix domain-containing protein, partial [Romboutsia sp.]